MRVLCENCGTTYKIPDSKLVREVNRATCRKCGHMMVIRVAAPPSSPRPGAPPAPGESEEERTLVTSLADVERRAKEQAALMEAQTARVQPVEGSEVTDFHEHTDAPASAPAGGTAVPEVEDLSSDLDADDIEGDLPTAEEPTQAPDELEPAPPLPLPAPPPAPQAPPPRAAAAPKPTPVRAPPPAPPKAPPPATRQTAKPTPAPPIKEPGTTTQPTLYGVPTPVVDTAAEASRPRVRHHDPSGDLTLVLMGTLLAMGGALLLAFNGHGDASLRFLGLLVALFGTFASFLVVATSNRGRRPASVVISLFLSVFGAVLFAGIAFVVVPVGDSPSLLTTLTQGLKAPSISLPSLPSSTTPEATPPASTVTTSAPETTPTETPAPTTAPAETPPTQAGATSPPEASVESILSSGSTTTPATTAPATTAPATTAPATTAPAPVTTTSAPATTTSSAKPATPTAASAPTSSARTTTTPTSSARTTTTPSTSTSSRTSTSSTPVASSSTPSSTASTPASAPSSSSSSSSTASAPKSTLQPSVVDTMVRTNSGVKRCFVEEKQRSGELPSRVDVKITIIPSGKVTTAAVKGGDYAGTALDSCLSGAIKGIQFPPFEGDAVSLTYPFIL